MVKNLPLKVTIQGYDELERQLKALGINFPKAKVRAAARQAVKIPLKESKRLAPEDYGHLKKGIVAVEEQEWKKNKKLKKAVFQVFFDEAMNDIFQKKIPPHAQGTRGGKKSTAYYPVSQEYGFMVSKNKPKKEGEHFIENAVKVTGTETLQDLVDRMLNQIKKIAAKHGGTP